MGWIPKRQRRRLSQEHEGMLRCGLCGVKLARGDQIVAVGGWPKDPWVVHDEAGSPVTLVHQRCAGRDEGVL